jgi:hypothetical protein
MDISEAVTEFHKMKRGNYAVRNSDNAFLGGATSITERSTIASDDIREALIGNNRQAGTCEADVRTSHNRHERGSMCAEHSVQGEPIQYRFAQQIERSTWSMAITLGQTRVVITETNTRSAQVCASQIRHLVRSVQVPSGKELVLENESV